MSMFQKKKITFVASSEDLRHLEECGWQIGEVKRGETYVDVTITKKLSDLK